MRSQQDQRERGQEDQEVGTWRPESADEFLVHHLPGSSPAVIELRKQITLLNSHRGLSLVRLVLITGESGSGKGHVGRVLAAHARWMREKESKGYPGLEAGLSPYLSGFQSILLPALPEDLIESELFGFKPHAFTGADTEREGYLAQDYSDILLDEVGDATPTLQGKLLQVLDERRFLPLGSRKGEEQEVRSRLLAATNRDLEEMVRSRSFRQDLYWRLAEHPIRVPSLREQPENIELLTVNIISELTSGMYGLDLPEKPPMLTPDDITWATSYPWPGNVRELKHYLRVWLLSGGSTGLSRIAAKARKTDPSVPDTISGSRVYAFLDDCLRKGEAAASNLERLLQVFSRSWQRIVVRWYDDRKDLLTDEALQFLFPEMKPSSLRTKLSQWRARGEHQ